MLDAKRYISADEYLELEKQASEKQEYWHGGIFMMAGASRNHNLIAGNVYFALRQQAGTRGCTAFMADVRLRIDKDNAYVYPDVMLVCGVVQTDPRQQETVLNPIVLVEVLSDSTAGFDRNEKFKMYRHIPSLEHYVMIDQAEPYIEAYRREGRFWVLETLEGLDAVLKLRTLDLEISMQEIYAQVEWS